jgi:hypothetical protein
MKTTRKQAVINKLWKGLRLIDDARLSVLKLNENGHQFDYVSDPKLSDVIDRLNKVSNNLDWIVYQKYR